MPTTSAIEAHKILTARNGFGIQSATQIGAAGISWAQIHAMVDAGLVKFEREVSAGGADPARVITLWRVFA